MKNEVQKGDVMDWTNSTGVKVLSGAVVPLMHNIGIAVTDIDIGAVGAVRIEGCFTVPKLSGAVWVAGEKLMWDLSGLNFDDSAATPATGDITGAVMAMAPGLNGEVTAVVKLTPGNNLRT